MTEPTLFDIEEPHTNRYIEPNLTPQERRRNMVRRSDPQTSWDTATQALPKLTETKQKILRLLDRHPDGLTSSEVAKLLDLDKGSSSKRLSELEREGLLVVVSRRLSDRKRMSSVYKVKGE